MRDEKPGNCYKVSLQLLGTKKNSCKLIHGLVFSTKLKRMIRHAWLEDGEKVFDFSEGKRAIVPREKYYHFGKVEVHYVYSKSEAMQMARETGKCEWWTVDQQNRVLRGKQKKETDGKAINEE